MSGRSLKRSSKSLNATQAHENHSPRKLRNAPTLSSKGIESIVSESSPTVEKLHSPSPRRTSRVRSIIPSYSEKKSSRARRERSASASSSAQTSDQDDVDIASVAHIKPTTLFDEDGDVEGDKLYSFKTPKKKDSMALLAQLTPKTPRHHDPNKGTPRTPINKQLLLDKQKTPTSRPSALKLIKTPKHDRAAVKKRLAKIKSQQSESEEDYSPSSSDCEPSFINDSDEASGVSESESTPPKKALSLSARVLKTPSVASSGKALNPTRRSVRNKGGDQYMLQPDDYFSTAASKTKTSNHTLDRLKNPRLQHDQIIGLLSNMTLSKEHEQAVKDLNEEYKSYFDKWMTLFDRGYTVILHGLGSKRNLLQNFHKEKLSNQHVLVINGFFPSLTLKDILDSIWVDILEMSPATGNPNELVRMIETEMKGIAINLFLIVHNIDGTMLRNDKAQSILSRLATIKNLHMICSIDHINAPLLWNNVKLGNFNFVWFDVASFLPYTEETLFENSLLVQNSGALELSSMKSVFQSLTSNARGIYILVMKHQLKNSGSSNYQGMSFKQLYSDCREAFLVSSDVALRAQLTEFFDHKLAKMKRGIDGAENITIPIKKFLLEQFLSELD